jgi:hypothetical protein
MKIYKFSNILSIPFAALFLYFISFLLKDTDDFIIAWAIIPLAALILIYLFQPQIDYWWLSKYPVEVDEKVLKLIERTNQNYGRLDEQDKIEFNKRLLLYVNGKSFLAKGMESDTETPYDIKFMIAQIPVCITMRDKEFLLKHYDRIILYKHAFPSPRYKFLHTVETHPEDGVILFSLEHAEAAFFHPEDFYNVVWHGFLEAYVDVRGRENFPQIDEGVWSKIESISGFTELQITNMVGYKDFDPLLPVLVCYFCNRDQFIKIWPEMHTQLLSLFI